MSSSLERQLAPEERGPATRFARLASTVTFRGGRLVRWLGARALVVGAGNLGVRAALEIARSGARVAVCDPDVGAEVNLGTQAVRAGVQKALSTAAACNEVAPGSAQAFPADVRSVGLATLRSSDVILDCSDDAALAWPLTELSNGLGIPLLRLALDGSGRTEVGRVLCSAGGAGHACQLCSASLADLTRGVRATPCPGRVGGAPQPTAAGGALGMAIAGLGVLQAQRLVTGNDLDLVLDRELLLDLSHLQLLAPRLRRSHACVSGHSGPWELVPAGFTADAASLGDVFALCAHLLGAATPSLEPYGHPLALHASCACGAERAAVGSVWSAAPTCSACGRPMQWQRDVLWPRVSLAQAAELGILARSPADLGLPRAGALFVARAPRRPALRLLVGPTGRDREGPEGEGARAHA